MYSLSFSNATLLNISSFVFAGAPRLPIPNRHIHNHGHYRTPQKSG